MSTTHEQLCQRSAEVRHARAELKEKIERGEVFAASVVLDPPEYAERLAVGELLMAQRRWGLVRMRRLLRRLEIPEYTELGGPPVQVGRRALTDRQRKLLVRALGQGGH